MHCEWWMPEYYILSRARIYSHVYNVNSYPMPCMINANHFTLRFLEHLAAVFLLIFRKKKFFSGWRHIALSIYLCISNITSIKFLVLFFFYFFFGECLWFVVSRFRFKQNQTHVVCDLLSSWIFCAYVCIIYNQFWSICPSALHAFFSCFVYGFVCDVVCRWRKIEKTTKPEGSRD